MKINAIIQARMNSARLPGKVLLPMCGKPALGLLIERVRRARRTDEVWVATTRRPADQAIIDICDSLNVPAFRGSEENVLQRVAECSSASGADVMVELTGDNPLIDPRLIDDLIKVFHQESCDFATNVLKPFYTLGMVAQVVSNKVLQTMAASTTAPLDQEHPTRYILKRPDRYKIFNLVWPDDKPRPEFRLTLDAAEDYKLIKTVVEALYPRYPAFTFEMICNFLDNNPAISQINQSIVQKRI